MATPLYRPVCDLLGCAFPIVFAGRGGVARADPVAAATAGGGFGFLGMMREPAALIVSEASALRARGIERFGVNLVPVATDPTLLEAQVSACIDLNVPVVGLFRDVPLGLVARLRAARIAVACGVGSRAEAQAAEQAGAAIIIAQGVEARGHVRGDRPLHELVPEIAAATALPVLAAGGLRDGADLATMLSLGAQGGVFGAATRVRAIAAEAADLLSANVAPPDEPVQLASPACLAHEMDDRYMGYAARDELLPALNALLEAERAGARVTLATAKGLAGGDLNPLILAIHRDEARWCGVLTRAIHRLQGTPSSKTGAFHDKALAIADLPARLAFLNRGQGWVVRKLKALLPTIRDEAIHADLSAMLMSHERNIARVAARLSAAESQGGAP